MTTDPPVYPGWDLAITEVDTTLSQVNCTYCDESIKVETTVHARFDKSDKGYFVRHEPEEEIIIKQDYITCPCRKINRRSG